MNVNSVPINVYHAHRILIFVLLANLINISIMEHVLINVLVSNKV